MEENLFKVISNQAIARGVNKIEVFAPQIARKALTGQFVMLRVDEKGERIPLTVADKSKEEGNITIIFQQVGLTTKKLAQLKKGDNISDLAGPLGRPTEIKKYGTIVLVGGGVGIAEMYPVARAFREADNKIISILGARSKDLLILENELKVISKEMYITTDDGSYGRKGLVTDVLKEIIEKEKPSLVYAIGPIIMMKAVSELTRPYKIHTIVSLNSIMVDGTGMCGSCRVRVDEKTKFACVDGPEFDGHLVDFDELSKRLKLFIDLERISNEKRL
ncbi:MAG: sulfide/dihydroorotate dehydrogenase-like FAD/NAD-binding protein [Candidatus Omnitrophica bacterium]|nr:sulfide/dihydroorotate dehydrogenase-like FAD/NAD-binding protein [Candidatus Omnitrophota bacterium]